MKVAAVIIAFLFLLFTMQPIFVQSAEVKGDECTAKTSCCKKMQAKKSCDKKEKKDESNNCNDCTALMCSLCCSYIPSQQINPPSLTASLKIINKRISNFFILSSYQAECFHPPEINIV
jgi:hypothetical protein